MPGMKVYRAADTPYGGPRSCWAEDRSDAEVYLDNPPFGGSNLYEGILPDGPVLDVAPRFGGGKDDVPEEMLMVYARRVRKWYVPGEEEDEYLIAVGNPVEDYFIPDFLYCPASYIEEHTGRMYPFCLWEEFKEIRDWLEEQGYVAVRYEDDYPEMAIAYFIVSGEVRDIQRVGGRKKLKSEGRAFVGKGWHGEPQRHALASRGMRTK